MKDAAIQDKKENDDPGTTTMDLDVSYSIDHTYTWATTAAFQYASVVVMEGADAVTTMGLSVSTTKSIINQLTCH
mgnify:CR=1 FL=1